MAPKIVDKEAKKRDIILAAIHIFSQKGIAKSKMIDIAQAAQIGKGTIYEYFRSKEEIFSAAFEITFQEMETRTQEALSITDNPLEQLKLIVDISFNFHRDESREFAAIMMDFWAEGVRTKNEKMLNIINLKQIYNSYRTMITSIIENGIKQGLFKEVDAPSFAAITIGLLDGIFLQNIIEPDTIDIKQIENTITNTLLNGLLKTN